VAAVSDLTAHILWEGLHGEAVRIWWSARPPAGAWSAPMNVSSTGGLGAPEAARISAGPDDSLHAVWDDNQRAIFYAERPANGAWSAPTMLAQGNDENPVFAPAVAVNPLDGGVLVAWVQGFPYNPDADSTSVISIAERPAGAIAWTQGVTISENVRNANEPDLAAGADGAMHLVWTGQLESGTSQAFYRRRAANGAWETSQAVAPPAGEAQSPAVAVDPDTAQPVVAWSEIGETGEAVIFYAGRSADGVWDAPVAISDAAGSSSYPDVLTLPAGGALVVWSRDVNDAMGLYYAARRRAGEAWTQPITITAPSSELSLSAPRWTLDAEWNVHLVWASFGEGQETITWHALGRPAVPGPTRTPTATRTVTPTPTASPTPTATTPASATPTRTATATRTPAATRRPSAWLPLTVRGR